MFYPHTTLTLTLTPSYTHTPTLPARKHPACRGFYGWVSDSIGRAQKKLLFTGSIAMLHCWCNYAAPLVPECFTLLALPRLLVFLCWTVGIAMLNLWYSYAEPLVPECYTLLVPFFQFVYRQYQGENQNEEWRNEVRRPEGKPMKNCRPLAD